MVCNWLGPGTASEARATGVDLVSSRYLELVTAEAAKWGGAETGADLEFGGGELVQQSGDTPRYRSAVPPPRSANFTQNFPTHLALSLDFEGGKLPDNPQFNP